MRKIFLFMVPAILFLLALPAVHAHCPLCTAAIATGAVTAKYYGLGDNIIGLFIGAFAASTGLWVGRKIKKQYIRFQVPVIVLSSFLLTVVPLLSIGTDSIYVPVLLAGPAGSILNKVYFLDKMLLGGIVGGLITISALLLHLRIKKINGGVILPFQGIVITLAMLVSAGAGLYFTVGA